MRNPREPRPPGSLTNRGSAARAGRRVNRREEKPFAKQPPSGYP
jgi:hypothetical protein